MERKMEYDVVVIGGGASGIAAAIGARKCNQSVLLIERSNFLGGQATNSSVASYCGFFTREENPKQIVGGVGQMVLDKMAKLGKYNGYRLSTMGNAIVPVDSEALKYVFDELVIENDVDLLLCCNLFKAITENNKIVEVQCLDDLGVINVRGKVFIDTTGDGNLAYLSGAETIFGNPTGVTQMATLVLRVGNFDMNITVTPKMIKEAIEKAKKDGLKNFSKESGIIFKVEANRNGFAILPSVKVESLDCQTLTKCEINTRKQTQDYIEAFRRYIPGMEECTLISTGPKLGIRETRHIVGKYTLTGDEVLNGVKNPRSIARGAWPCENHSKENEIAEYLWLKEGDYYDIPLEILQSKNIENLWCAGRLVSADPIAFASVRVMGISFATGHAAGVGAAHMAKYNEVDIEKIQEELRNQGAII
jgi:hypothetical protein